MEFTQESLLLWFSQYTYQPMMVYIGIIVLMTASSFGLPVPEEVTLISVGMLAYMAQNQDQFPPPFPGAEPVNLTTLMIISFLAVFISDFLVYAIGKYGGVRLKNHPRLSKYTQSGAFTKAEQWTIKYGSWMSGVFRFTPGLRFPGHLMCGMLGVPAWKFIAVDGTAALLSVPTQIWFVANYGEYILTYFKQFKMMILGVIAVGVIVYLYRKHLAEKKSAALDTKAT